MLWLRPPDREVSGRLPLDGPSAPPRILWPPGRGPPFAFCAGDPLLFQAGSLLSAGAFRPLSMVFVRVLSNLLRARTVRPASVLRVGLSDVPGESATRGEGEVAVPLRVVLPPREDAGLFAALPTVFREVMGLL